MQFLRTKSFILMGMLVLLPSCNHQLNEEPVQRELIKANSPNGDITVSSVAEIGYMERDGTAPKAIDAHVANQENWPGILVTRAPGDGKCTSTLVGKNTILTAAHCVDRKDGPPSSSYDISFDFDGGIYPFVCEMASDYANSPIADYVRSTRDVALCKATRDIPAELLQRPTFEVVNLSHTISSTQKILVGGYGCVIERVSASDGSNVYRQKWDSSNEAKYRIGNNLVKDAFRDRVDSQGHIMSSFTTESRLNDRYTDVCQGDSGGPIFYNVDYKNELRPRRIIGVVSGNILQLPYRAKSVYTDLGQKDVVAFFNDWLGRNPGQEICGVNVTPGTRGCRQ